MGQEAQSRFLLLRPHGTRRHAGTTTTMMTIMMMTTTHLVDGDAVLLAHLVELVNAHDAAVRHDHRAASEVKLATGFADD